MWQKLVMYHAHLSIYSENYKYMLHTIQWGKFECKFDKFTGNSCLLYRPGPQPASKKGGLT